MTLFRIYLVVRNFLEVVYSTSVKTARRALMLTYPQEYVFFNGYTTPYLSGSVNIDGPGVPAVSWIYNLETNVLMNGATEPLKSLPWLAASIRYNGLSLYSLDDFVSEVKYVSGSGSAPPPAVIVGSWSLRTGVVLDNQVSLELCVITEEGEEKTVSPWSLDPIASTLMLELNSEAPALTQPLEPMKVELTSEGRSISLVNEELDEIPADN